MSAKTIPAIRFCLTKWPCLRSRTSAAACGASWSCTVPKSVCRASARTSPTRRSAAFRVCRRKAWTASSPMRPSSCTRNPRSRGSWYWNFTDAPCIRPPWSSARSWICATASARKAITPVCRRWKSSTPSMCAPSSTRRSRTSTKGFPFPSSSFRWTATSRTCWRSAFRKSWISWPRTTTWRSSWRRMRRKPNFSGKIATVFPPSPAGRPDSRSTRTWSFPCSASRISRCSSNSSIWNARLPHTVRRCRSWGVCPAWRWRTRISTANSSM